MPSKRSSESFSKKIRNHFGISVFCTLMKTQITTTAIVSLLSFALFGSAPLRAQQAEKSESSTTQGSQTPDASTASSGKKGKGHGKEEPSSPAEQEKARHKGLMKQINNDPQVVAAREAMKDAQTEEAKKAARKSLREARHELLKKADPSQTPVQKKEGKEKNTNSPVS